MPSTVKKEFILPDGQTREEVTDFWQIFKKSIIEMDTDSIFSAPINTVGKDVYFDYFRFNTSVSSYPTFTGAMYWDYDDKTPVVNMPPANGDSVKLSVGQEMYIRAVNKTGATVSNGAVVFVDGAQGNRPSIALADADNYDNSTKIIGLTTEEIPNNLEGYVTTLGLVRDLDTSVYSAGDCLYLSTVSGTFGTVTPADGKARIRVGMVTKSHVTDGWICVHVQEDKYMFGDPDSGSYSYSEETGVWVSKGRAVTYRDEYVGGIYFVPQGANAPDEVNVTIGGVVTKKYAFDGVNTVEKLGNTFEIAHDVDVGSINAGTENLQQHIHIGPSNATSTGTAKFFVDWCLVKSQGAPITGTQISITVDITASQQYYNLISGSTLPTTSEDFAIGDLIEFTLTRNYDDAGDTYPADVIFYKTALHVPMDTQGSRQLYVK